MEDMMDATARAGMNRLVIIRVLLLLSTMCIIDIADGAAAQCLTSVSNPYFPSRGNLTRSSACVCARLELAGSLPAIHAFGFSQEPSGPCAIVMN